MIDEKKIEHEAICYTTDGYGQSCNSETLELIEESFKSGADWAINEFLNGLWHSNAEKPKENSNIVYIDEDNEFWDIDNYNSDDFDDSFGKGWDSACRTQNIYKWAYKEDLFPKEGGNHD